MTAASADGQGRLGAADSVRIEAVAGTDARLAITVRDRRGEVLIAGGTASADVDAVCDAVRAELDHPAVAAATFHLAADHPADRIDPLPETVADRLGFAQRRDLLQLRRPLPVAADHPSREGPRLTVRPIHLSVGDGHALQGAAPGTAPDVAAWLRVNNRAFAGHADQGGETVASFLARLDIEWTDPSGFLLADDTDRPGELAGFCWTKVHAATKTDPVLGEIYVIGVDPTHRGESFGPSLVLAGLDHLHARGIVTANLYVDADNEPARRLYDRLGFTTHQRRRVYSHAPS